MKAELRLHIYKDKMTIARIKYSFCYSIILSTLNPQSNEEK